jgi:hypothetical protein
MREREGDVEHSSSMLCSARIFPFSLQKFPPGGRMLLAEISDQQHPTASLDAAGTGSYPPTSNRAVGCGCRARGAWTPVGSR